MNQSVCNWGISMKHSFRLSGLLDVSRADTLHGALDALLVNEGMVTLEADSVERIDTSIFQLLVAFKRELNKRGFDLQWSNASDVIIFTARSLGLLEALNLSAQH